MSGFGFHLTCGNCRLESPGYPYRAEDLISPSEVVLPATNSREKRFASMRFALPPDQIRAFLSQEKAAEAQVVRLATAASTQGVSVILPTLEDNGLVFTPRPICPRCGSCDVRFSWGAPNSAQPRSVEAASVETLVSDVLDNRSKDVIGRLASGVKVSRMQMFGKDQPFRWTVSDASGHSFTVAEQLLEELQRRGMKCGPIQRRRASCVFEEL